MGDCAAASKCETIDFTVKNEPMDYEPFDASTNIKQENLVDNNFSFNQLSSRRNIMCKLHEMIDDDLEEIAKKEEILEDYKIQNSTSISLISGNDNTDIIMFANEDDLYFPSREDIRRLLASYPQESIRIVPIPSHVDEPFDEECDIFPESFTCDICLKTVCRKQDLIIHLKDIHRSIYSKSNYNFKREIEQDLQLCFYDARVVLFRDPRIETNIRELTDPNPVLSNDLLRIKRKFYKCPICKRKFLNRYYVKVHMRQKHMPRKNVVPDRRFACSICSYATMHRRVLVRHIEIIHKKIKNFSCSLCHMKFSSRWYMKNHTRRFHEGFPSTVPCKLCGKSFATLYGVKAHMRVKHFNKSLFICDQCGKSFKYKSHLKDHIKHTHLKQLHPCKLCDKTLATLSALSVHMRGVHENIRSFKCPSCELCFHSKNGLKTHVTCKHSSVRQFQCVDCFKSFKLNGHLKQHWRSVHIGDRNHVCPVCHKAYKNRFTLNYHVRCVHDTLHDFKCDLCDKMLHYKKHMINHMRNIHNVLVNDIANKNKAEK